MPIVTVTALPADAGTVDRLLTRVVADVAAAVQCPAGDVWASYVVAVAQHVGQRPAAAHRQCPVVVIRGRVRADETVAAGLGAAARAVAEELGVPTEDVWLHWVDVLAGRGYAGDAMR